MITPINVYWCVLHRVGVNSWPCAWIHLVGLALHSVCFLGICWWDCLEQGVFGQFQLLYFVDSLIFVLICGANSLISRMKAIFLGCGGWRS